MRTVIRNAQIVNEGSIQQADLLICDDRIERIGPSMEAREAREIDAKGAYLLPGIIDDQVHFREPGLTHKACIATESAAAAAGGVTSFMDMPNVKPPSLSRELLEERYNIASRDSAVNYSFYMGVSNDNIDEVLAIDPHKICGVKIFMGSSTGNMLVDSAVTLDKIFADAPTLIAVHCEDENRIKERTEHYRTRFGQDIPVRCHPEIRDEEACMLSSSRAVALARKHGTRLHVLHISTWEELGLFDSGPIQGKRITAEACVHHLYFDSSDYAQLGSRIKCNPAIKSARHRNALRQGLLDDQLDVVATDHAPHTLEEKSGNYFQAPSGLPLVQHSFSMMVQMGRESGWELPFIAQKMSHAVADCFHIRERGYLREGYFADFFLWDEDAQSVVEPGKLLYRCGWSPLEGRCLPGAILGTWVNGSQVWDRNEGLINRAGSRLLFH